MLIQSNKPEIASEDEVLQLGQQLRVPLRNGVLHTVLSAQSQSVSIRANISCTVCMAPPVQGKGVFGGNQQHNSSLKA